MISAAMVIAHIGHVEDAMKADLTLSETIEVCENILEETQDGGTDE